MSQANTPSGASKTPRTRKYWIGANWKCNGSINFIKDSVQNMYNDIDYDKNQLGKWSSQCSSLFELCVDYTLLFRFYFFRFGPYAWHVTLAPRPSYCK